MKNDMETINHDKLKTKWHHELLFQLFFSFFPQNFYHFKTSVKYCKSIINYKKKKKVASPSRQKQVIDVTTCNLTFA